jgi:hypothetical protein
VATRRAGLRHRDLAAHPGAGVFDRPARSRVVGPNRLEQVKDVLRACGRPEREVMVIRVGEAATSTKRDETGITNLREDNDWSLLIEPMLRMGDAMKRPADKVNRRLHYGQRIERPWPEREDLTPEEVVIDDEPRSGRGDSDENHENPE